MGVMPSATRHKRPADAVPYDRHAGLGRLRSWPGHAGLRDTGEVPLWIQVALPIFTALLGGAAGFGFSRLDKNLDRQREWLDAQAAAKAAADAAKAAADAAAEAARARELAEKIPRFSIQRSRTGYQLENLSPNPATDISLAFDDYPREKVKGLPNKPFSLGPMDWVVFRTPTSNKSSQPPRVWIRCAEIAEPIPLPLEEEEPVWPRGRQIYPE